METNAQELERRIEVLERLVVLLGDFLIETLPPETARMLDETIAKQKRLQP